MDYSTACSRFLTTSAALLAAGLLVAQASRAADPTMPAMACSQVPESFTVQTPWSEWRQFPAMALTPDAGLDFSGPEDLSAQTVVAWNSQFFFMVVRVTDDVFRPADSMTDFWNGDSIQFGIDPLDNTPLNPGTDADDVMGGATDLAFGRKVLPTVAPEGLPKGAWPVPFTAVHDGHTVTYAIALPWSYLGPLNPLQDRPFRFNLIVNDNDDGKRLGYLKISDGIGDGANAGKFRRMRFTRSGTAPILHVAAAQAQFPLTEAVRATVTARNLPAGAVVRLTAGAQAQEQAVPAGAIADMPFSFPAGRLPVGTTPLKARWTGGNATAETTVAVHDPGAAPRQLARAERLAGEIEQLLKKEQARGRTVDYFQLRLNLLRQAFKVASLAQQGYRGREDGQLHTYPQVFERATTYANQAAPKLRADLLAFAANPNPPALAIPRFDLLGQPWSVKGGELLADQTPVTLQGFVWTYSQKDHSVRLAELGLNFDNFEIGPNSYMDRPFVLNPNLRQTDAVAARRNNATAAQAWGEPVDLLNSTHYLPGWFQPGGEGANAWMDTPEGRKLLDLLLQGHAQAFGDLPNIKTLDLANEWVFANQSPEAMRDFRRWLQARHGSITRLNLLWGSAFKSFNDVPKPFDPKTIFVPVGIYRQRGAFWDWCCFNSERAAGLVRWMNDTAKQYLPGKLTHMKNILSSFSHRSLAQCFVVGTDPRQILPITDITGLDASYIRGVNWKDTLFAYDYYKSICPDKPIFCSEMHGVPYGDASAPGELRRGLFQRYLHGERLTHLFLATTTQVPEWWGNSESGYDWNINSYPEALEAYGTTASDLRRLTPLLAGFNRAPADLLLFYDAAADFGIPGAPNSTQDQYYARAKTVYLALLNQDLKTGIVNEQMLAAKMPPQRLIVLAGAQYVHDATVEALKRYLRQGGHLLWLGDDNLRFDPYGRERAASTLAEFARSKNVIRLPAEPAAAWPAVLGQAGITPAFATAGPDGAPVPGLELRSAAGPDGKPVVFLANVSSDATVSFSLIDNRGTGPRDAAWTDRITGRRVDANAITLPPNAVLLLTQP